MNIRMLGSCSATVAAKVLGVSEDSKHQTMLISQLPTDQWYAQIRDNTLADAILNRLMHNAHRIKLKGESIRKQLGSLTEGKHLS